MDMNIDLTLLLPHLVLAGGGLLLLILALFRKPLEGLGTGVSLVSCFLSTFFAFRLWGIPPSEGFSSHLLIDPFGLYLFFVVILGTILTLLISLPYLRERGYGLLEYQSLLLFATAGMAFLVTSLHVVTLYIGLELMALSSYALAAFYREEEKSFEAGLKYFILGTFSSAVLLYGFSLFYAYTGSLHLKAWGEAIKEPHGSLILGFIFIASALFFKIAAVPFHVWTPDVYEGAPTPITAFFSVGPKAAGFALLLRIFYYAFPNLMDRGSLFLGLVSALTMVLGNVVALVQKNVKRMLAYSAIAHTGYMLLGVLAYTALGEKAVLYYLLAYAFMNIGAFTGVLYIVPKAFSEEQIEDFSGLAKKRPWLAFAMLVFLLSLTGIPPTAGFFGKFFLFGAAIQAGYTYLAGIAVVMSAVSLYYYMSVVVAMYLKEEKEGVEYRSHWALTLVTAITLIGTVGLALYPHRILEALEKTILPLFS